MASSKDKTSPRKRQGRIASIKRANALVEKKANALVKLGLLKGGAAKTVHAPVTKGVKGLSGHQKYERRRVNKLFKEYGAHAVKKDYTLKPRSDASRPKLQRIRSRQQLQAATRAGYKVLSTQKGKFAVVEPDRTITKSGQIVTKRRGYSSRLLHLDAAHIGRDDDNPPLLRYLKRIEDRAKKAGQPTIIGMYFGVNEGNVGHILVRDNAQQMYDYLVTHYSDSTLERIHGIALLTYEESKQKSKETGAHIVYAIPRKSKYVPMRQLSDRQREHRRLKARIRYAHKKAQKAK
jgi:hypothetical protein